MRGVGALGRGTPGIDREHGRRPPAGEHHQVAFLPASGEEPVSKRVPQRVRVKIRNTGLPSSAAVNPALTIAAQALRVADHIGQTS